MKVRIEKDKKQKKEKMKKAPKQKTPKPKKIKSPEARQIYMKGVVDNRGKDVFKGAAARATDIKYRGPLSYRGVKIFGLLFLFFGIISDFIPVLVDLYGGSGESVSALADVLSWLKQASLPLILVSAFCIILKTEQAIKPIVIAYAVGAVSIYFGTLFVFVHYIVPLFHLVYPDMNGAEIFSYADQEIVKDAGALVNYNVFLDLLLCTLFYFFLNYKPKKLKGRKLLVFRWCAVLPVVYVVASIILFGLHNLGVIQFTVAGLAALVCRAPAVYVVFFALTAFLKYRKRLYEMYSSNTEQYEKYLYSRRNSLHFSLFCSLMLAVVSLIDFLLSLIPGATCFSIGNSYMLFLAIPFVLLMSYTRDYKNKSVDVMMPIVLILLVMFVIIEIVFKFMINLA